MTERPDTVHGRLLEAAHLSGYSFERAMREFDWLLDEGRWKTVGDGFSDINAFLATVDFSDFKIAVEQRKKIAKKLEAIQASQRATAKVLGIDKRTVGRDLNIAANAPAAASKPVETKQSEIPSGANAAPSLPTVMKGINAQEKQADKGARREQREAELGAKIKALPDRVYGLAMPDPPWRFEPYSRETGMDRAPDNHYATTATAALVKDRPNMANESGCFMWALPHMIEEALWLLREWGFEYRSQWIWRKDRMGLGYWGRNVHELLLIGTCGSFPAPAPGDQPLTVIDAPVAEHSVKPAVFYEIIERLYPSLPKLEMYARSGRPGWDSWGAEAPDEVAA